MKNLNEFIGAYDLHQNYRTRTILKLGLLILITILMMSCAAVTLPVEAYIKANCPRTEEGDFYNGGETGSPDAFLKNTKASSNESNKIFISYSVGADVSFPIAEKLSIVGGLELSGKGNKKVFDSGSSESENKLKFTYLDIPLLVRYELGEGGFNAFGGLQPSVLLSAKNKSKFNDNSETIDVKDHYKTLDVAATIGVGYNFDNGIGLNLAYDHGLTKINSSTHSFDSKNRVLQFGVAYAFGK